MRSKPKSKPLETADLPEQIQLTLLLMGGQEYCFDIEPNHPLLQQLFETLVENNSTRQLFQIPVKQGQAMLTFPSDRLIGIITEPPLVLQEASDVQAPQPAQFASPSRDPLISDYIQFQNFLAAEEHANLLKYVLQHQAEFVSTRTSTGAENYRESVVLYQFPEFVDIVQTRIQAIFPDVIARLGLPTFSIQQIEAQLTAHNHGNFYKVHNDNGSPDTATRELTYVYYFYQEPKAFSGGELVIYDSKIENNYYVKADTYKQVEPLNNSIVFFLSRYMHEVLPIHCPSQQFADSRFTINGWIRR
ncbi:MAG: hypothetical protein Kow00121_08390 [Elainellaceae cyanobacterium]